MATAQENAGGFEVQGPPTLSEIDATIQEGITGSEATLNSELSAVDHMTGMDVADMVQIQYDMANDNVAEQSLSAIMKDMSDTFKSVVQKIG